MPFTSTCPSCGTPQRLPSESRGKKVTCPECDDRYVARPAARKRSDLGLYLLLGALGIGVIAGGIVLFVAVRRPADVQAQTSSPQPVVPTQPVAAVSTNPAPAQPTPAPGPTAQPAPAEKPIVVAGDTLRQQFARDETNAERQYKDRTLEVTGTIGMVIQEAPLRGITFGTLQDPLPPLLFELAQDQAGIFAKLRPGQKVTVRGLFIGRDQSGFIGLSKCRVEMR
jgi:hypothetical protein